MTRDPMMRDEVAALRTGGAPLVRAHLAYVEGRKLYGANDLVGARRSYSQALEAFTRAAAPYRLWAQEQLALLDWQRTLRRATDAAHARDRAAATTRFSAESVQRGQVIDSSVATHEGLGPFAKVSLFEAARSVKMPSESMRRGGRCGCWASKRKWVHGRTPRSARLRGRAAATCAL